MHVDIATWKGLCRWEDLQHLVFEFCSGCRVFRKGVGAGGGKGCAGRRARSTLPG